MRDNMPTHSEKIEATKIAKWGSLEAYNLHRYGTKEERSKRMAELGKKGGKSPNAYRGFRDKPGLAKKANVLSRKGKR
jgi:hypothetical protein